VAKSDEEKRFVSRSELSSGVQLTAGHLVVLILDDGAHATTTEAPGSSTTEAPGTTTTGALGTTTTAHAGRGTTTTEPPGTTTTAYPGTSTTAQPGTTTTGPGTSTTAPGTTTTAPGTSTTQPATTTTAPAATPSLLATLEAAHFETARSFPLPPALDTFRAVAAQLAAETDRVLLVIGHTDTVGDDDYNLKLSEERASAVSAYLRNAVDEWMPFYSHDDAQKRWGVREDQYMLGAVPFGSPDYTGQIDGDAGPQTQAAWNALQQRAGVPVTGAADDASRRALVLEYMQAEGTTVAEGTSIDTIGCGERHLLQQTADGVANDENRRVDLFAFEHAPILPAPDECKSGTHPGCTVYDRWKSAVTGPLTGQPAAKGKAEVLVELDEAAADALPDGALVLSGEGIADQEIALSSAERADGVLRLRFSWDDASIKVKLEARAGGKSVTLWEEQAAGDPKTSIVWSGAVADLYPEETIADAEPEVYATAGDDLESKSDQGTDA
jgi:outer membrane protein OmpA-like peptidoglycan-associated protein